MEWREDAERDCFVEQEAKRAMIMADANIRAVVMMLRLVRFLMFIFFFFVIFFIKNDYLCLSSAKVVIYYKINVTKN